MHRKLSDIITLTVAAVLGLPALQSCIYDNVPFNEPDDASVSIRVNTALAGGSRSVPASQSAEGSGESFTVLFWQRPEKLLEAVTADGDYSFWLAPYLASTAPKAVAEYSKLTYDTNHPYPAPETVRICATGYAPADLLDADKSRGYYRLNAVDYLSDGTATQKGRCDFLGCDAWNDVYWGSLLDPFAQERNKLYFRHLASKLVFYAERDRISMENKQFVRFVNITDIQMSLDGGDHWTPLHTPSSFEWTGWKDEAEPVEFTEAYKKVITTAQSHNAGVTSQPAAGYRTIASEEFSDAPGFIIQRRTVDGRPSVDRVPISGHAIDSCYVCNPYGADGKEQVGQPILLRMNIEAELSFDQSFPKSDKDGSTTDDLTFTRTWPGQTTRIYEVAADGSPDKTKAVTRFKPGKEYRIYLNFSRTGVNLVAREYPWDYGGIHYVGITGSDTKPKLSSSGRCAMSRCQDVKMCRQHIPTSHTSHTSPLPAK